MTDEPIDPELDRQLDLLADEESGRPDPMEHPSGGTLSAYHAQTLSADQVSRVQEHLVACGQCRNQLLEYARFMGPPIGDPADNVSSFEMATEWRRLQGRMGEGADGLPQPFPVSAPESRPRILRSLRTFQALAAGLGLLCVGLMLHGARSQRKLEIFPVSQKTLDFTTTRSVSIPESEEIRLPSALGFIASGEYSAYRIEILDDKDQVHLSNETNLSEGTLYLEESILAPGTYKVRVYGLHGGQAVPVGKPRSLIVKP